PPLILDDTYIQNIKSNLPELPDEKIQRYCSELGLKKYDAEVLTSDKSIASYFEEVIKFADPILSANWIIVELFGRLNKMELSIDDINLKPKDFSQLLQMISSSVISGKTAKHVLDEMLKTGACAEDIVKEQNLAQITDEDAIIKAATKIIENNADKVEQYFNGKEKLLGFFVGKVLEQFKGKANPQIVNQIILQMIHSKKS
ncbi:MAG: Asp-tRNA(Asn)/Glu-tRNA(Gln) amidotransferase GatCAB subunit B, partial [Proteobacteria bacterium]|nr:Asp-tRNA(Asn)/Glu-tRNA(Gln) amidotransferase GatCAB subunit B [Pseudomonadota bacterium]